MMVSGVRGEGAGVRGQRSVLSDRSRVVVFVRCTCVGGLGHGRGEGQHAMIVSHGQSRNMPTRFPHVELLISKRKRRK